MVNVLRADRQSDRLEVCNTIILAVSTLAVAWCSYQAALWNGIQTFKLAESNKYSRLAQQKLIQSGQNKGMEEAVMITFINAALSKDSVKMNYILRGVRPELANILSNWKSHAFGTTAGPLNPMVMPEYEAIMEKRLAESENMSEQAALMFSSAQIANLNGDRYSLFTVLFSMVLFLGAITTKLARIHVRLLLTIVSAIICLGSLVLIVTNMPIAHKG
jgi:hypothetical protein